MRNVLAGLLIVLSSGSHAIAGAWTLPKGEAQAIVTASYSFAGSAFDGDGKQVAVQPFEKYELRGYAEYGLTDWATLVAQPELRFKEQDNERTAGLGRFDLGIRTRFWRSDFAVASVEASVSAPGQSDELTPLNGGDTDWEFEGRALVGRGFDIGWRHGFVDAQVGYRHRFSDPADEVVFDLTVGLDISENSFGMLQSFNRLSVGNADLPFAETQEHKLAFSVVYRVDEAWSVQSGTIATAYGRNVLREQGFLLSVWRKF